MSTTTTQGSAFKRPLAALGASALAFGIMLPLATSASAAPVRADLSATCAGLTDDMGFTDIGGYSADAQATINCLAAYEITQGTSATTYTPGADVQRYEMALFLVRLVEYVDDNDTVGLDFTLDTSDAGFTDLANVPAEGVAAVNAIANLGVSQGTSTTTFSPFDSVSRVDMARFINRIQDAIGAQDAGAEYDPADADVVFTDVAAGSPGADEIYALQSAGIVQGTSATTYEPFADVQRSDMAFFIMRHLDENVADGRVASLSVGEETGITLASATVQQGGTLAGEVTGADVASVTVTGCGFTNAVVANGPFSLVIPATQAVGTCDLVFTLTDSAGVETTETETITVTAASVALGTGTSRPELASATIVQTLAVGGTTVRYTFDEPLTGASVGGALDLAAFHAYNFGSTGAVAAPATSLAVDTADTKSVLVTFSAINSAALAETLGTATVDAAVVTGLLGTAADENIAGDAGLNIGAITSQPLAAGITVAPDLVTVGNFRVDAGNNNFSLVDFTFDEAADNVVPAGYSLVGIDGIAVRNGTVVAGDATTVHTVRFDNREPGAGLPSTIPLSPTTQARGVVAAGTVEEAGTFVAPAVAAPNVRQAADVAAAGNSETPDLVSASIIRDATVAGVTGLRDQVLYTFDEPVLDNNAGDFVAYLDGGAVVAQTALTTPTRSTANDTQVLVTFGAAEDALDLAVGASVGVNAVTEAAGALRENKADEVGLGNIGTGPTTTTVSGRTDGPDLTAVAVERVTDGFGTTTGATARYTFDEDVVETASVAYQLYEADGTLVAGAASAVVGATEDTDNQVVVTFAGAPTDQVLRSVVGTVDDAVVNNMAAAGTPTVPVAGTETNPEGASLASGSTGTPRAATS